jgi:hypothetical protein
MTRLTLWNAYLVETLRANGMDNSTLLEALKKKDVQAIHHFDESFNYQELIEAYQANPSTLIDAIENSYTVTYLTINGLRNLLRLKFGFVEGEDYTLSDTQIDNLVVNPQQLEEIITLVGSVWYVQESVIDEESHVLSIMHSSMMN